MPPRPQPIEIGPVRASAMNRTRVVDGQHQFYWRARSKGDRSVLWCGWGTRDQVQQVIIQLHASGKLQPRRQVRSRSIDTVRDLVEPWFATQRSRPDLSPSTVDHYEKNARHLVTWLGSIPCPDVTRSTLERYRDDRLREGASPRLVLQEVRTIRMVWRWAFDNGDVQVRDLPQIQIKIEGYVINHRTPDPEEIAPVLAELSGVYLLVGQLLAITGARISEICSIRSADLDTRHNLLTLDGKTGPRQFPLPDDIATELADQLTDTPLVNATPRTAAQMVRDRLRRACKAADVPVFTPHGLRRMVVNRMLRAGVDVKTAASLTGHSVEVMLHFYREVSDDERRHAVQLAGLGHFPTAGAVVQGPWRDSSSAKTGTGSGNNPPK
jgi:integrase